jgi:hypothetical protein
LILRNAISSLSYFTPSQTGQGEFAMRKPFAASLLCLSILAVTLVFVPGASPIPPANAATAAVAAPAPTPQAHPEIRDALEALRTARAHLKEARHDFGGHRAEALKEVDRAINQLQICMKYDR